MSAPGRIVCLLLFVSAGNGFAQFTVRSGAGLAAATAARNQFRADIGGGTTAGADGSFGGVRREINWDDVPDAFAAPNNLPPNFFNVNSPRGVLFSTPGTGFQVSASAASGTPVRFGNLDPSYPSEFVAFSSERLFTPLGQPVTDITFFLPGTNIPAAVSSFGVMLTDVDYHGVWIDLFGPTGNFMDSLLVFTANHDVSFVGITFERNLRTFGRVRIRSTRAPGPGQHDFITPFPVLGPNEFDVVAIDDLIYSEPVSSGSTIPALSVPLLVLLAGAFIGIGAFVLRR